MHRIYFFAVLVLMGFGGTLMLPACKGDKGVTGPTGGQGISAVPTPYCGSPTSHGATTIGSSSGFSAGFIVAQAVTLTGNTVGTSLSFNVASGPVTGQVIMGIYTDNAGSPGNLVVQTNPQFVVTGWNTCSIPNVYLPAGTYWATMLASNANQAAYTSGAGGGYDYYYYGWGELPESFPVPSTSTSTFTLYLSTCP